MRTAEDNAREFALLDSGEGWPFAVLVACSVESAGHGGNRRSRNDRNLKLSAAGFAEIANKRNAPRILRYLEAWNRAASIGLVPPSNELVPNDVLTVGIPDQPWKSFYDASKSGGRPRASATEIAESLDRADDFAERILESASPEAIAKIAKHPKVRVETTRQRSQERLIVDPAPEERPATGLADGLGVLLAMSELVKSANNLADLTRRGAFNSAAADVRDEALGNIRDTQQTLDFIAAIIEGQSVTDQALSAWLAAG